MHYTTPLSFKAPNGTGVFVGHGAIFRTRDLGGDAIQPGAFTDTLKEIAQRGAPLPVLFGHDQSKPIGRYTALREDTTGLLVEGTLTLETVAAKEAYALMRDRAVSGLSIGYDIPRGGSEQKGDTRLLHKLTLHEISLVAVPMHPDARVTQVKALADCADARELTQLLHHEHEFSRTKAAAAATALWRILRGEDYDPDGGLQLVNDALKNFTQSLKGN